MTKWCRAVVAVTLVIAGAVIATILGWWLWRLLQGKEETAEARWVPPQRPAERNIPVPFPDDLVQPIQSALETEITPAVARLAVQADDLTRIDGIGPKYAEGLARLGVTTFAQLSQQDADELAARLKAQGLRIIGDRIRQEDWIGQAARLAGGQ
ncbi:MAG: DUF4332 domain-containing protein [Anaerolineae bacterium]|nr:DUF4332 domain-containing protein [Anaerolineae bacterium]